MTRLLTSVVMGMCGTIAIIIAVCYLFTSPQDVFNMIVKFCGELFIVFCGAGIGLWSSGLVLFGVSGGEEDDDNDGGEGFDD